MSQPTTASPAPPPAANRDQNAFQSVASLIESRIREAQNALWWSEFIRSILRIFIGVFVAVLLWVVMDQWIYTPGTLARVVGFSALIGWVVHQGITRVLPVIKGTIRPEYAARSLERDVPEMRQELTSYVTLRDQSNSPSLNGKVIRSIGAHAASRLRTHDALPVEATGTLRWWIAAASLMAIFFLYAALSPKNSFQSASRLVMPIASIDPAKRVKIRDVVPGDAEVLAGRTVEVSAVVEGLRQDEPVVCRWQLEDREAEIELIRDADSGRFAGEVSLDHASSGQVPYQIVAGDDVAGPFYLSVQDVPVVAVQSIRYVPPAYTQKQPHTSSSAAITALDGTRVTVTARTNRPIEKATIQFNPKPLGDLVHATAGESAMSIDDSGTLVTFTFPVRYARQRSSAVQLESYRIKVWDNIGQTNPAPIVYPIRVNADLSPEVTIVMPQQSPKNIPIDAQQIIEIHAADADFGLQQIEIEIRRGIEVLERATLWSDELGKKGNQIAEYRFRPHEHFLRVGDAVQVTAIATDNREDESDPLVEPNVAKTDPLELRITMSEPVPKEPTAGDGLSSPDNKPAADPNAGESSDEGGQGGSGGSSSAGGKGESGKQSGGSSGGGEGGESGEPQDGDQEKESGSSGGGGKQPNDQNNDADENASENSGAGQGGSSQGDASDSNSKPSDDSMGNSGSSDPSSDPSKSGDADPSQTPPGNEDGSQNAEGSSQGDGKQPQGSNPSDPQNAGKPSGDSKNGAGQGRAEEGMMDPSKQDSPQDASNSGGSGQHSSGSQEAGSDGASGSEKSSDGGKPETPEHDGEAFERIRDYLDKKKQEQAGQGTQNDSAAKPESQPGQNGENQSGSKTDGANQENDSNKANGSGKQNESGQGNDSNRGEDSKSASSDGGGKQPDADKPAGNDSGAGESAKDPSGSEAAGDAAAENKSGAGESSDASPKDARAEKGDDAAGQSAENAGDKTGEEGSEKGAGSDPMNEQASGEKGSGEKADGEQGSGEQDGSKQDGSKQDGSGQQQGDGGDKKAGETGEGEKGSDGKQGSDGNQSKSGAPQDASSKANEDMKSQGSESQSGQPNNSGSKSESSPESGQPQDASENPSASSSQGSNGSGSGADTGEAAADLPPTPDPIDLDYAKKSTDMVLDYLDETRDQPDQELLEKLNWSEDDMQRFVDRWKSVRELDGADPNDPNAKNELTEALESLGMRPPTRATSQRREQADALRGLRDAGNRTPPPAAYQDAFDSFRRAIGGK
ncbi:circumsporozoite protein- membrane associated protein [Novipirellula sp. SH528]|uniref:circumsporozoite protein- membrane associated protein n=1 Tax=Novipirellula sp. SH528 TaxID=3454466 RepID=UPI003F9FCAFF